LQEKSSGELRNLEHEDYYADGYRNHKSGIQNLNQSSFSNTIYFWRCDMRITMARKGNKILDMRIPKCL
jgi:hypothetical protein